MYTLDQVVGCLQASFDRDTCFNDRWRVDNPPYGHCSTAALVLQEYFGGYIVQAEIPYRLVRLSDFGDHFYNYIDGSPVDVTKAQFPSQFPYEQLIAGMLGFRRIHTREQLQNHYHNHGVDSWGKYLRLKRRTQERLNQLEA